MIINVGCRFRAASVASARSARRVHEQRSISIIATNIHIFIISTDIIMDSQCTNGYQYYYYYY